MVLCAAVRPPMSMVHNTIDIPHIYIACLRIERISFTSHKKDNSKESPHIHNYAVSVTDWYRLNHQHKKKNARGERKKAKLKEEKNHLQQYQKYIAENRVVFLLKIHIGQSGATNHPLCFMIESVLHKQTQRKNRIDSIRMSFLWMDIGKVQLNKGHTVFRITGHLSASPLEQQPFQIPAQFIGNEWGITVFLDKKDRTHSLSRDIHGRDERMTKRGGMLLKL